MINIEKLNILTDTAGGCTVYSTKSFRGKLLACFLKDTDLAAGADFTLTTDQVDAGIPETLLGLTDKGADFQYYPRRVVQGVDGANLTGTQGGDCEPFLVLGRLKLTVAAGGSVTSAVFYAVIEE